MLKTMRVVFALALIVFSFDLFRPKATDNILIGKWGPSGSTFIFQPDGTVEFHAHWQTFALCVDGGRFDPDPDDYYRRVLKETNDESYSITEHIFIGRYKTRDRGKILHIDIQWLKVDEHLLNSAWTTSTQVLFDYGSFDYRDWMYQMLVDKEGESFSYHKSDVK